MRPMFTVCAIAVLAAMAGPFFLKIDGQPIMTVDQVVSDISPAGPDTGTEVFRWQDAEGNWHFAQQPPPGIHAEALMIEDKITPTGQSLRGQNRPDKSESTSSAQAPKFAVPGIAAYADGGKKLMENAKSEVEKLNQRTLTLEQLRLQSR